MLHIYMWEVGFTEWLSAIHFLKDMVLLFKNNVYKAYIYILIGFLENLRHTPHYSNEI